METWFPSKRNFWGKPTAYVKAVDGVSFQLKKGESIGLVGESGCGKTTLGRTILKLIEPQAGRIVFAGSELTALDDQGMQAYRKNMQIVFQDPYGSLSPRMSVAEIVAEGLRIHEPHLNHEERDARVIKALGETGLDPETRHRYPHEFSGGQRQRIAIARAVVLEPKFIMLDEPTSALDMSVQAQVVDLLRDLQKKRGLAYMFISHDLKVVRALANEVIVMRSGKVVEQGTADQIFGAPKTEYTKALMAAAFDIETAPSGVIDQ